MLLILSQPADQGASYLNTKFLKRTVECNRLNSVTAPESGTWLFTLLRGNSGGLCDGRSILCVGASGISLRDSKINSFVTSMVA